MANLHESVPETFIVNTNIYISGSICDYPHLELTETEAAFLDLHLSISNDIVSTKIYDKRDYFDFEIVNFPFVDGGVPRSTSYGVLSLNSFVLVGYLAMLLMSTLAINY